MAFACPIAAATCKGVPTWLGVGLGLGLGLGLGCRLGLEWG